MDGAVGASLQDPSPASPRHSLEDTEPADGPQGASTTSLALPSTCRLSALPPELIDAILNYLSPVDLASVSRTCHGLRSHAISDTQWYPHVQSNVPGLTLRSPSPCNSYRDLYVAHDPRWFLTRHKIWFCDRHLMGKMIVARFDPRRGCIEGYQLLAVCDQIAPQQWPADGHVVVHYFEPHVRLHLDKPVMQFHLHDRETQGVVLDLPEGADRRFSAETPMRLDNRPDHIFSNFSLARALPPDVAEHRMARGFPYDGAWPPPAIPAPHRVSGFASSDEDHEVSPNDRPACRKEASDRTFRIRQWMEMTGTPNAPGAVLGQGVNGMMQVLTGFLPIQAMVGGGMPPIHGMAGPHIGEEVITYSTLDPELYTPTKLKPWRGIWVGDYSGHGCEFLLLHQPDREDDDATDEELGIAREVDEPTEAWEKRRMDARIYRGRLEAIKLTGDPNVPRGELTFVAEDLSLSDAGFVGINQEPPFQGAYVVKSRGHVAGTGFTGGELALLLHREMFADSLQISTLSRTSCCCRTTG